MTIDPQIQQLSKHDFVEYIHQLQILAREKYSFDIFIENSLSQIADLQSNKREIDTASCIDLNGQLDDVNIRELAYN